MPNKYSQFSVLGKRNSRSRLSTLALLFTAAGVLVLPGLLGGCASAGQDQNYKLLEEDRPMFDTRPDTSKPGEARHHHTKSSFIATAPQDQPVEAQMQGAGPEPTKAITREPGQLQTASPAAGDTAETDPATIPEVQDALAAAPAAGRSINGLDRSHWSKVVVGPDLSAPYQPSYFQEADAHTNVWCLIAFERACFAAQVVALPVKMIITPPWSKSSSSHAKHDKSCGQQGQCCMNENSEFKTGADEYSKGIGNVDEQKSTAVYNKSNHKRIGCLAGNHTGCVLCNCTSLKNTDEHTCDECCS